MIWIDSRFCWSHGLLIWHSNTVTLMFVLIKKKSNPHVCRILEDLAVKYQNQTKVTAVKMCQVGWIGTVFCFMFLVPLWIYFCFILLFGPCTNLSLIHMVLYQYPPWSCLCAFFCRIPVTLVTRSTLEVAIPEHAVPKLIMKSKNKLAQISEVSLTGFIVI